MSVLTIAVAAAHVQSVARDYPEGITIVSGARENLLSVTIQNRDNKAVYFWHGSIKIGGVVYPENPADWTPAQVLLAEAHLQAYGEKIDAGQYYQPNIAQRMQLYSFVPHGSGVAKAHVKVGFPSLALAKSFLS